MEQKITNTDNLFEISAGSNVVMQAPSEICKNLERDFIASDRAFRAGPPQFKNESDYEMPPEKIFEKQRDLETKHLKKYFTHYAIEGQKQSEYKSSLERQISYILNPLSSSSDSADKAAGAQMRSYAVQVFTSGLGEKELNNIVDSFITEKNSEALGELRKLYSGKQPTDKKQIETLRGIRNKIDGYFKSTNLALLESELHFVNVYQDLTKKRIEQINSKLKMPGVRVTLS